MVPYIRRHWKGLLVATLSLGVPFGTAAWIVLHGVSARDQPTALESLMARSLRHAAIPATDRNRPNPIPVTASTIAEGRMHWADHCAQCHGNDGRGQTDMGRNLYPKAPDMTLPATQKLSDGELFAIITNGVRLTGMPAWGSGSPGEAEQTWKLVRFIRHLPQISAEELQQMKAMNPTSPMQKGDEAEEDAFLNGKPTQEHK